MSFSVQIAIASFDVQSTAFLLVERYRILEHVRIFVITIALANIEFAVQLVVSIRFSVIT